MRRPQRVVAPPPPTADEKRIEDLAVEFCQFAYQTCQCFVERGRPRCDPVLYIARRIDARYMAAQPLPPLDRVKVAARRSKPDPKTVEGRAKLLPETKKRKKK